ncbi:hypothetical protein LXL04_021335 [Taraxacum kok-saghyz]
MGMGALSERPGAARHNFRGCMEFESHLEQLFVHLMLNETIAPNLSFNLSIVAALSYISLLSCKLLTYSSTISYFHRTSPKRRLSPSSLLFPVATTSITSISHRYNHQNHLLYKPMAEFSIHKTQHSLLVDEDED